MVKILVGFFVIIISNFTFANAQKSAPVKDSIPILFNKNLTIVPQDHYKNNLSFLCKKEWQLQKATQFNIYFRLGSKEFVDFLEQKPNAVQRRF